MKAFCLTRILSVGMLCLCFVCEATAQVSDETNLTVVQVESLGGTDVASPKPLLPAPAVALVPSPGEAAQGQSTQAAKLRRRSRIIFAGLLVAAVVLLIVAARELKKS